MLPLFSRLHAQIWASLSSEPASQGVGGPELAPGRASLGLRAEDGGGGEEAKGAETCAAFRAGEAIAQEAA